MDYSEDSSSTRYTCLSLMLAGMFCTFLLFLLVLVTGGAIVYMVPVFVGLALFGWMHYLLWGKTMNQETAGEREEEEMRQQAERDGWPLPDPKWYGRY
jgi:hypothetical protein